MPRESIEEIISKEFKSLWGEMIESDDEYSHDPTLRGLCKSCDRADRCELQERQTGTWHCRDFE